MNKEATQSLPHLFLAGVCAYCDCKVTYRDAAKPCQAR